MKHIPQRVGQLAAWVLLGTGVLAHSGQASAAEPAATSLSAPSGEATTAAYTTKAGDTLQKLVARHYKDSPLKPQALVQAVRQLNPEGLPAKPEQRIKTGTVLQLPEHSFVLRETLRSLLPESSAAAAAGAALPREHWVRFP